MHDEFFLPESTSQSECHVAGTNPADCIRRPQFRYEIYTMCRLWYNGALLFFFFCGTKFIAIFTMSRRSALGFCQLKDCTVLTSSPAEVQNCLPFFLQRSFCYCPYSQPLLTFYLTHFNLFKLCAHLHGSNNLRFLKPVMY